MLDYKMDVRQLDALDQQNRRKDLITALDSLEGQLSVDHMAMDAEVNKSTEVPFSAPSTEVYWSNFIFNSLNTALKGGGNGIKLPPVDGFVSG